MDARLCIYQTRKVHQQEKNTGTPHYIKSLISAQSYIKVCIHANFVVTLPTIFVSKPMQKRDFNPELMWRSIRKYLLNKYVITLLVFALIMLFSGEERIGAFIKRGREIRKAEEQRDMYRAQTQSAREGMLMLQNTDSLERYAREYYYMHAPNEDVYLVDEK